MILLFIIIPKRNSYFLDYQEVRKLLVFLHFCYKRNRLQFHQRIFHLYRKLWDTLYTYIKEAIKQCRADSRILRY